MGSKVKANGERLREIMKERGLTQAQLAEMSRCSKNSIGHWSSGMPINYVSAQRLAEALNVDVHDILEPYEEPHKLYAKQTAENQMFAVAFFKAWSHECQRIRGSKGAGFARPEDYVWDWLDKNNHQAPAKALKALREERAARKKSKERQHGN